MVVGAGIIKYILLYELKFKANCESFAIWLGDAQNQAASDFIPYISFHQEANGKYYMDFNGSVTEIQPIKNG